MNYSDNNNLNLIPIIVVGYNRLHSIKRLLNSLLNADYKGRIVPLIISIDCSNNKELYDFVESFIWPYGEKIVNIEKNKLGLKKHIFQCANLSKYFKAIILLEDDLYVSEYFFSYVIQALEKYGDDEKIAQISLYNNEINGFVGLPLDHMHNGYDVFLQQDVSTWGQCWTWSMWSKFLEWFEQKSEKDILNVDMSKTIKSWKNAWSRYFIAYVVSTNRYCIFPYVALSTNFSDAGVHGDNNPSVVQVNLQQGDFKYRMPESSKLVRYDIYSNNEMLYDWLHVNRDDLCLDLYGDHETFNNKRFILTTKCLPYKITKSYALYMRPWELNVRYGIEGDGIYLYDTSISSKQSIKNIYVADYYLRNFNDRRLFGYVLNRLIYILKNKLRSVLRK